MSDRLGGKVAIITGGGNGIGAASARLFAAQGANIGICDLDEDGIRQVIADIERSGGQAVGTIVDVSNALQMEAFVGSVVDRFGRLDVLFSNAGIGGKGSVVDIGEAAFNRTLAVNLGGAFLSSKYAIPHMERGGGGSILFTASELALVGSRRNAAYSASKAALIGMARSMALDHAGANIRVNVIAPGAVETNMLRASIDNHPNPASYEALIVDELALGRIGLPEEIARTALFLASDDSSFITGTTIVADGGATAQ